MKRSVPTVIGNNEAWRKLDKDIVMEFEDETLDVAMKRSVSTVIGNNEAWRKLDEDIVMEFEDETLAKADPDDGKRECKRKREAWATSRKSAAAALLFREEKRTSGKICVERARRICRGKPVRAAEPEPTLCGVALAHLR